MAETTKKETVKATATKPAAKPVVKKETAAKPAATVKPKKPVVKTERATAPKAPKGGVMYRGLGRRKTSVARVVLRPGKGDFWINKRQAREYLMSDLLLKDANQPLVITETFGTFDVTVNVRGGGLSGQAGAIRLGIARALLDVHKQYRPKLKAEGMLTRDARSVERKKPGLRKARRAKQFSKR